MCYHRLFAKFNALKNVLVEFGKRSISVSYPMRVDRASVKKFIIGPLWKHIGERLVQSDRRTLVDLFVVSLMVCVEKIIQCVDPDGEAITSPWCKAAYEIVGAIVTVIGEAFDTIAIDIGRV